MKKHERKQKRTGEYTRNIYICIVHAVRGNISIPRYLKSWKLIPLHTEAASRMNKVREYLVLPLHTTILLAFVIAFIYREAAHRPPSYTLLHISRT